ncbi:MAG: 2-C-methyl-D-erythritol 2,4-cyclodiphosphate synthase [Candidatus Eremiobacteraeota bacterium]|nr:2-C-methyl-D-erythritol 2,4-cyclodiphosphate synthase [Candidatus Eremiobacteraeota bacterium]
MSVRVGHGFDAHPLVEGRPLKLGGVHVPFERGLDGHSDADVLCHAIADALLGACALGDLGTHFPATEGRWKGADSIALLEACTARVRDAGFEAVNIDATVVAEKPKLASYVAEMRARIAAAIGIDVADVSVKPKSTEGMGYTGDGTGMAAHAVALVRRRF